MLRDKSSSFTYLIFASLFSLILAYIFGNDGYEAFITIAIALAILISWQLLGLVRLLFRTKIWLIVKFMSLLFLGFIWVIALTSIMISGNVHNPAVSQPPVNWLVVIIGTLPFLIPRLLAYGVRTEAKKAIIGTVVSFYSLIVLYVAAIGFYDHDSIYRSLILVLAVQLQYIMSYAVTKTSYLKRSYEFAGSLARRFNVSVDSDTGRFTVVFIVGLPLILPLAIVLFAISLH